MEISHKISYLNEKSKEFRYVHVLVPFSAEKKSRAFDRCTEFLLHHLRMADLRARLGITVEKSEMKPSIRGVKSRELQANTRTLKGMTE
uniref:Uncharacterized protein n=1 Tax=Manihot esculenta TaxID=3983 RepID=A0A2C9VJM2_MANES